MAVPIPPPVPPSPRLPSPEVTVVSRKEHPTQTLAQEVRYLVEPLCNRAQEQDKAVYTLVHDVSPVLQQGPMCGLVALSIASQLLTVTTFPPQQLLASAREKGYSINGEMFSAQHLLDLARSELKCTGSLVDTTTVNTAEVLTAIASKSALVVPYDADKDHSPCLARGHRAHWCTLVGFAIVATSRPSIATGTHIDLSPADFEIELFPELRKDQVFVFARQGKSQHLGLWDLPGLLESNANLMEAGDHRSPADYVIPSHGLSQSLASLLLHLT